MSRYLPLPVYIYHVLPPVFASSYYSFERYLPAFFLPACLCIILPACLFAEPLPFPCRYLCLWTAFPCLTLPVTVTLSLIPHMCLSLITCSTVYDPACLVDQVLPVPSWCLCLSVWIPGFDPACLVICLTSAPACLCGLLDPLTTAIYPSVFLVFFIKSFVNFSSASWSCIWVLLSEFSRDSFS